MQSVSPYYVNRVLYSFNLLNIDIYYVYTLF